MDRVKWHREHADCTRFREEVETLEAEFERTTISFNRMAVTWSSLFTKEQILCHPGAAAYASRKADMYRGLAGDCQKMYITARLKAGRQDIPACGKKGWAAMGWDGGL